MDHNTFEKCHVFICYRQQDGLDAADWLYHHLHGRTIQLERSNETLQLDVYLDRDAPAVDNWQEIWLPKLQVARALLFVCTPSAAKQRNGTDWVYRELDKWIAMRQSGPIVIDATGEADKYLPRMIQERWPNAQRIVCRPDLLERLPVAKRNQEGERIISRILRGIRISEEGYWLEELERLKALNRRLVQRLVAVVALFGLALVFAILFRIFQVRAEREATIALAGQMTATSELLQQQDGPLLETSVLLAMQAYGMNSEIGGPSINAWRALNQGIALLPQKVGRPLYPFGPGVPVHAYIGKTAVLFTRRGAAMANDDPAALWSFDEGGHTWRCVRSFNAAEHGEPVSVSADGRWMVTRRPGEFAVWNSRDGTVTRRIPLPAGNERQAMAVLSPGGRWLAKAGRREFRVFDLHRDPDAPGRLFPIGWPQNAVFSPNERQIAYAAPAQLILYNLETGEPLRRTEMPPGADQVGRPIFSPDGAYMALPMAMNQTFQRGARAIPGGVNYQVYVYQVPQGGLPPVSAAVDDWQPYEVIVRADRFDVVFDQSRDTPKLAILDGSQPVQILDLFSKVSFTLSAGEQGARRAAFESGRLLTVNQDGTARLWGTQQRMELMRLTHRRPVREAHFLQGRDWGGAQALTVADDGEVRLWERPRASLVVAAGTNRVMKWSSTGDWMLSADNRAYRIDGRTGEEKQIPLKINRDHRCMAGALSPDGRYAVFATQWAPPGAPQTLRLVDISEADEQIDLALGRDAVNDLAVAAGGSPVIATTEENAVLVWIPKAATGAGRLRVFKSAGTESTAVGKTGIVLLDPSGDSFLRIFGKERTTLIRRSSTGEILGELNLSAPWNPDRGRSFWQRSDTGNYFAFKAGDHQFFLVATRSLVSTQIAPIENAKLLQVDNDGRILLRTPEAFMVLNTSGEVLYRVADASTFKTGRLGGDGKLLVAVESDGAVTVRNLANGLMLAGFPADNQVRGAMFGPGGDHLILLYPGLFRMRLWKGGALVRLASTLIGRALTQEEWQTHVGQTPMR